MNPDERILPSVLRRKLATRYLGRRVYYYPEIDSTNRAAFEFAKSGEPEGTLVITDFQTSGRGRADHVWTSPPGKDLLFSVILRPDGDPGFVLTLTLAFSVTIAQVLSENFGFETGVKWPNDIFTRQGKIGGILAERAAAGAEGAFVIAGMGINVNSVRSDFPREYRERAVSCRSQSGRSVDRAEFLGAALVALEECYEKFKQNGFAVFKQAYLERLLINGWRIWFERDKKRLAGTVEGVQEDGALLVRLGASEEPVALYNETVSIE